MSADLHEAARAAGAHPTRTPMRRLVGIGALLRRALPILALGSLALPTAAPARDGELHTFHCLHGCPTGAPGTNDTIVREIYTLSNNDLTKIADWVAYRITSETIGRSDVRDWRTDPALAPDEMLTAGGYEEVGTRYRACSRERELSAPVSLTGSTPAATAATSAGEPNGCQRTRTGVGDVMGLAWNRSPSSGCHAPGEPGISPVCVDAVGRR